jgi:hydrogenase nickel incorporation protein HypA/HybF
MVQMLEAQSHEHDYQRVTAVWLEIGPFSGLEMDALRFSFDVVTKGTLAEGAKLEVINAPAMASCRVCGASAPITTRFDPCPACGSYVLEITTGEQLRIKQLEVE